jgi:hypothetical protein
MTALTRAMEHTVRTTRWIRHHARPLTRCHAAFPRPAARLSCASSVRFKPVSRKAANLTLMQCPAKACNAAAGQTWPVVSKAETAPKSHSMNAWPAVESRKTLSHAWVLAATSADPEHAACTFPVSHLASRLDFLNASIPEATTSVQAPIAVIRMDRHLATPRRTTPAACLTATAF